VSDLDDDRPRASKRFAVRFFGEQVLDAKVALEAHNIPIISAGSFFPETERGPKFEHHAAVGVHALSEDDAIRQVKEILDDVGEFSDFEAAVIETGR
jgi:hypothetical protein